MIPKQKTVYKVKTLLVFITFWVCAALIGDGHTDEATDYISISFYVCGLIWLIARLYGYLNKLW